ncbi:MAG: ribosome maturation factor RimP [Streptosporangiales bacterium]|nr:ribosome maturation factor RimP [Streptosporangiales bacterium]
MHATDPHERLTELVRPVVTAAGLDLEALTVQPAGRRRVVRVVVDRDGGVTSDDLAGTSQEISRALDAADAMGGGAYTLELTSPGTDRPLAEPRHWRRAKGRLVRAPLRATDEADEDTDEAGEARGRVTEADDEGVVLEQDGTARRYPYESLGTGRIELEFRRSAADESDEREDVR